MAFSLKNLTGYKNIVIQCHDNPDADALASGFALQLYFKKQGMNVPFVYGGKHPVSKSNLTLMIQNLKIDVKHVNSLAKPDLLICVDCQYGESNVTGFEAENIAIIDHHQSSGKQPELSDIRSSYGSCSTILFELLTDEGYDINKDFDDVSQRKGSLSTALYYGLMTDTGNFSELCHPADRDLQDSAKYNTLDITLFRNSNYSKEELSIAADALKEASYNSEYPCGIISSKPCDPNILGLVSDMFLEVDSIGSCLVYSVLDNGVKYSVRSCVKEVKANELAAFLGEGLGGGGGHLVKAGGFLKKDLLLRAGISCDEDSIDSYFKESLDRYFKETEIIYAGRHKENPANLSFYRKLSVKVGFVKSTDLAKEGSKVAVRTLEGDVDIAIREDSYIIIGVDGEIYPCKKAKFESNYELLDEPYVYPKQVTAYNPTVNDLISGERIALLPFAKSCIATGGNGIYARELDHRVKVFTTWDPNKYYLGKPGDYLAVRVDDLSDVYIIERSIFEKTYRKEEKPE